MVPYMWVVEWPGMRSECTSSEKLADHIAEKWTKELGQTANITVTPLYKREQGESPETEYWRERAAANADEIDRLKDMADEFRRFANHLPSCASHRRDILGWGQLSCDCGYNETLAKYDAMKGEG